ncbi:MAG: cupin domain-containing protein [Anaerolineales bacterium]|jgi:quercetin dioxygenase-like cupin family protein
MNERSYFITDLFTFTPELPKDSILSRSVFSDDRIQVILFSFTTGQELSEHTATRPAILHFLEGEADVTLGLDRKQAHAGTWIHMPANLVHSVHAKTDLRMLLILLASNGETKTSKP